MEERADITGADTVSLRLSALNAGYSYNLVAGLTGMGTVQGSIIDTVSSQSYPLNGNGVTTIAIPTGSTGIMNGYKLVFGVNPLSIKGIDLSATAKDAGMELNWATTAEDGVKEYHVERSLDGRNYTTLQSFPSKGDGDNAYTALDALPHIGYNYYRIAATDSKDNRRYSGTLRVKWNTALAAAITIYPNPVNDGVLKLSFNNVVAGEYTVNIYNIQGMKVASRPVIINTSSTVQIIDVKNLPAGQYYLAADSGADRVTTKFLVKSK